MDFTCHVGLFGSDDDLVCFCVIDYRRLLCRLFDLALVFSFRFLLIFVFSASLVAAVSLIEELCGIWGLGLQFFVS